MTTHAPIARLPFAPLDNPRLQHLASAKNRQNGVITPKSLNGKLSDTKQSIILSTSSKRAYEPSTFDDVDTENVDPAVFDSPSKKSKTFAFELTPVKTVSIPSTFSSRLVTPAKANMSSPRAPLTAPAGRSPKRKILGVSKNRRVSAPFTRIDPPFGSRTTSTLPFSLDAALSGTFAKSAGATIQESMPKNWFFDIYEDTPEEEAANLMEHSTLTLDLSSDEESNKKAGDDRGKENTPPEGYDAPTASRPVEAAAVPVAVKKTELVRRKIVGDEMDDGERSPLSDLETEPFFPDGLDKASHVVIDAVEKKKVGLCAAPVEFTAGKGRSTSGDHAVTPSEEKAKDDFVVWEDTPATEKVA